MSISDGRELRHMEPSNALVTIPNVLSIVRGCLGPVVMALITLNVTWALVTALVLMVLAEASDVVDGIIARRFQQESQLGRLIDPICDSIYHLSVFLAFLYNGWMPAWMLFIVYSRDLAIPYLRAFAKQAGHDIWVRNSGKVKTAAHAVAQIGVVLIALGLIGKPTILGLDLSRALLLLAAAASLYSLADYAQAVLKLVRK
ncbi:MAG: CDP-diacylglycerol--glycerol-3-phosphate 3-phosphatidyltransferase [Hyphomicrobiaceae bacterium]